MSSSALTHKQASAIRRTHRTRAKVAGNSQRPRLNVHISNLHVTAQIIDDSQNSTLAHVTTVGSGRTGTLTDKAAWVGGQIAAKAQKAKVKQVVLDRGPKKYHGRIKALAEAARAAGLEF